MTSLAAPTWCRWARGDSALLVIAPHGGRRPALSRGGAGRSMRKVNDLFTADLAGELAAALGAAYVGNPALDRNQLDLNRISQVAAPAAGVPALIQTLPPHAPAPPRPARVV